MSLREYTILHRDPLRNRINDRPLVGELSVKWLLNINKVGKITLTLPSRFCQSTPGQYAVTDFAEGDIIEVYRWIDNQNTGLVGNSPFIITYFSSRRNRDGQRIVYIEGENGIGILNRRKIALSAEVPETELAPRNADDQMKFLVRNNTQPPAASYNANPDPLRDISPFFTVEADAALSPVIYEGQVQGQTLLAQLNKIVQNSFFNGTPLFFDVVQTAANGNPFLEFRTSIDQPGIDRRNGRVLRDDDDTIAEYSLDFDWRKSSNRAYGGGRGQAAARNFVTEDSPTLAAEIAASPFALREHFYSSNADDPIVLVDETQAELQARLPVAQASGVIGETETFRYGLDWTYGDRLQVLLEGVVFDVYVDTEEVSLQSGEEVVRGNFSNNLNQTLRGIGEIYQDIERQQRQLDYFNSIERN